MRIIHELYGKAQTTLSGRAYSPRTDQPPKWGGMRMEILICDGPSALRAEGDAIEIEGDSRSIRVALEAVLEQMAACEAFERERFEARFARYVQCSKCQRWTDPADEWHGDGTGERCVLPSGVDDDRLR